MPGSRPKADRYLADPIDRKRAPAREEAQFTRDLPSAVKIKPQ